MENRSLELIQDKRYVRELFERCVLDARCSGCAACVLSCPVKALDYDHEKPVLLENCIDCELCFKACPRLNLNTEHITELAFGYSNPPSFNEAFGNYLSVLAVHSAKPAIRERGQDGGLVSGLILWMMEKGLAKGAVVAQRTVAWDGKPTIATTPEEVLAGAGSVYTYVPNSLALLDAKKLEDLVFVGTGCQVTGVRQLQAAKSKALRNAVKPVGLTIGLFCTKAYTYEGLMRQKVQGELGISADEIAKMNIKKGNVHVTLRSGEDVAIPLKEVNDYTREGCLKCPDFSAEYADISVGGLGQEGWSFIILRTELGQSIFDKAAREGVFTVRPMEEFPDAMTLLVKSAKKQRARGRAGAVAVEA
ncbi:MAG: Coenzyme F420 hydrogenase/dehydrogenase, beta subunit C-terminal domain [Chloroflexi bacterium]|nr:Coenzyme F420 hydrogenase/dehydrogenase, beta subunit C-terminal domain [Chloroflexota bacterium]